MNERWVSNKEACRLYSVSGNTLRSWADKGRVIYKRTPSNQRIYLINSSNTFASDTFNENKQNYLYARVSSSKQKDDLVRQSTFLQTKYPNHIIIKDIGSGLNYKRKGLLKLLELSCKGLVNEVVIYSKDRLCRFGYELIEWLFLQHNTKLVVLEQIDKSPEQEFSEDILSILQVFACHWNGKRKYTIDKNKEIQIEIKQPSEIEVE